MNFKGYSFCESSAAGSLSPWHIRKLGAAGVKLGGGIDTPSLCGRVDPEKWNGWDVAGVAITDAFLDGTTNGRRHVCAACVAKYRSEQEEAR